MQILQGITLDPGLELVGLQDPLQFGNHLTTGDQLHLQLHVPIIGILHHVAVLLLQLRG